MNQAIMWIMAAAAVIGGVDRIVGNRTGLGKKFEEGFLLLGPTALSMAGIICLVPLLSKGLQIAIVPIYDALGLDAGMLGGILAIDMGGYQLAMELSSVSAVGRYAGIMVAATFGCTISFTIPVGMGMLEEEEKKLFAEGVLIGMGTMPVALFCGGLFCSLDVLTVLKESIPVLILAVLLMAGLWKFREQTVKGFSVFAGLIRILTTIGLICGAVSYMTGWEVLPGTTSLSDAMKVVSAIGIVMLGSLPAAELLQRALKKPLDWVGDKTGMNGASIAGLLMGIVSIVPAIAMMREMDERGKVVNAAFAVCGASALAAHMGFAFGVEPTLVIPLLVTKVIGGCIGAGAALILTEGKK